MGLEPRSLSGGGQVGPGSSRGSLQDGSGEEGRRQRRRSDDVGGRWGDACVSQGPQEAARSRRGQEQVPPARSLGRNQPCPDPGFSPLSDPARVPGLREREHVRLRVVRPELVAVLQGPQEPHRSNVAFVF